MAILSALHFKLFELFQKYLKATYAIAAETLLPLVCRVSVTATKLIAPPICLAAKPHAIFHPSLPNEQILSSGKTGYAKSVPIIVPIVPTKKEIKRDPVFLNTRFKSESNNRSGIANGIRFWFMIVSYFNKFQNYIPQIFHS